MGPVFMSYSHVTVALGSVISASVIPNKLTGPPRQTWEVLLL